MRLDLTYADHSVATVVAAPVNSNCVAVQSFGDITGNGLTLVLSTMDSAPSSGSARSAPFSMSATQPALPAPEPPPQTPSEASTVSIFSDYELNDFGYGYPSQSGSSWFGEWSRGLTPCSRQDDGRVRCVVAAPPQGFDLIFNAESGSGWACEGKVATWIEVPAATSLVAISNGMGGGNCQVHLAETTTTPAPTPTPTPTPVPASGTWQFSYVYPLNDAPATNSATEVFIKGAATWLQIATLTPSNNMVSFTAESSVFDPSVHVIVIRYETPSGFAWACEGTALQGQLSGYRPDGTPITPSVAPNQQGGCDIAVH
jgi:hypothetical protein